MKKTNRKLLTRIGIHVRQWMTIALVLTDLASLLLAFVLAVLLRIALVKLVPINNLSYAISRTYSLWPILILVILAFTMRGLYPAVGLSPVDELRITTTTISLVFLMLLVGPFWVKTTETYSRLILTFAWLFSLVLIQANRWLLRVVGSKSFWGEPIVVIGNGPNTERIVNYLNNNNHLGLRPVMVLEGSQIPSLANKKALRTRSVNSALLVTPEVSDEIRDLVINDGQFGFRRIILISSLGWVGSLGVVAHDLEGILGMEVRQNLLNFWQRGMKRGMDVILAILLLVLVSPLLLIVSIAIKLEDNGEILYNQIRVGQNGREFVVWKFRTMVPDADQKLQNYLDADPNLKNEWSDTQKIKNDPRLTRVGKLLRKWSIDELPQLINVIRGEMSLVGPRPFFSEQSRFYGNILNLYYRVRPGMTGMWQVSGRNEATYAERVRYDEYYIRNWSIWLDIYLLLRTIWVVIRRKGAY